MMGKAIERGWGRDAGGRGGGVEENVFAEGSVEASKRAPNPI